MALLYARLWIPDVASGRQPSRLFLHQISLGCLSTLWLILYGGARIRHESREIVGLPAKPRASRLGTLAPLLLLLGCPSFHQSALVRRLGQNGVAGKPMASWIPKHLRARGQADSGRSFPAPLVKKSAARHSHDCCVELPFSCLLLSFPPTL